MNVELARGDTSHPLWFVHSTFHIHHSTLFQKFSPEPYAVTEKERSEIESRVCRLVVATVLVGDGMTVNRVFEKCVEPVGCRFRREIYPEGTVVLGAKYDFLAPVPKDISLQARPGLGGIVAEATIE